MKSAERTLLLALFRWARSAGAINIGWVRQPIWGTFPDGTAIVAYDHGHAIDSIQVRRATDPRLKRLDDYPVRSVAEAVDILAALDVIPKRFSTAYAAGWTAGREDIEHPVPAGAAFAAIVPAVRA
jgi:hypothetical protein